MKTPDLSHEMELQRILWACYQTWQTGKSPPADREICHTWVSTPFRQRFGSSFHQGKLRQLVKLGLLREGDSARAGNRRYYTMPDPWRVEDLLRTWGLN